ncbi:TPA: sortase B protein-sorting domain-containing protein [Vibrio harveyi]
MVLSRLALFSSLLIATVAVLVKK